MINLNGLVLTAYSSIVLFLQLIFFRDGYMSIPERLGKDMQNLYLNTPVKSVTTKEQKVVVTTSSEDFLADAVLVTVPLGVLKAK
jgi:monoamine oxidase